MSRATAALFRIRWLVAGCLAAACLVLGRHARQLGTDPSNSAFIIRSGPSYQTYQTFRQRFGSDQTIVIGLQMLDGLSPEHLPWIADLTRALEQLPHVEDARSLSTIALLEARALGRPASYSAAAWAAQHPSHESLAAVIRAHSAEGPLLVSADGRMSLIVLHVAGDDADRWYRHRLVEAVRQTLAAKRRPDMQYLLTGTTVEQDVFVERVAHDRRRFVPLTVMIMAALLWVFHRRLQPLLYAGAVMAGALTGTEGLMALTGHLMNPVTVLLAPIILVVAVGYTVQLGGAFPYARGQAAGASALAHVYRSMTVPCGLAMLTTVIGFLALLASAVPAEREFAWFGACGTLFAWLLAMGLAPAFLSLEGSYRPAALQAFQRTGTALARGSIRRAVLIVPAAVGLVAISLAAAPRIRHSTDLLQTLKADDPFRKDTEAVQSALGGIYPLEIMLEAPAPEVFTEPETWDAIEAFHQEIAALPLISHTFSIGSVMRFLKELTGHTEYPAGWVRLVWETLPQAMEKGRAHWVADAPSTLRLSLWLRSADTAGVVALAEAIERLAAERFPAGWRARATGHTLLLARMSQRVVDDETASLGIAFGLILGIAWLALRSWPYALMTILPNLFPVTCLFGLMALWRIPLNTATAMIASVALGLIFDNTIYILYRFREARRQEKSAAEAAELALARCLHPVLTASLVLAGGFAVTISGGLLPTVQFGLLTCTVILLALLADTLLLPALLGLFKLGVR